MSQQALLCEYGWMFADYGEFSNALISRVASVGIEAITGSQVATGSTRMKAGTAQSFSI